jgi:hypothetical protein
MWAIVRWLLSRLRAAGDEWVPLSPFRRSFASHIENFPVVPHVTFCQPAHPTARLQPPHCLNPRRPCGPTLVCLLFSFERPSLFLPIIQYGRYFFPHLCSLIPCPFALRPLLLAICSHFSFVRLRALVPTLYINRIFLDCCNVFGPFPSLSRRDPRMN